MDNDNKPARFCYPYPHAAITADCIVFGYDPNKTLRVLLVKRRNEPYKDCWAFPGGFMEIDEDLETCARREVMEETGMALGEVFQFRSYSAVDRDPRERVITVVHFAFEAPAEVKGSDDAAEARWFDIDNLPELAFDHRTIIHELFEFLEDVIYNDLFFKYSPEGIPMDALSKLTTDILQLKELERPPIDDDTL
mgnify:FL=1